MDREGYPAQDLLDYAVSSDEDDVDIDVLEDDVDEDRMDDFRDEYLLMVVGEGARNSHTTTEGRDRERKHVNNDNGTEVEGSISSKSGVLDHLEDEGGFSKLTMEGEGLTDNTNHLPPFSSEGGKESENVSIIGEEVDTVSNTSEENEIESEDPFPIIVVTSAQSGRTMSRVGSSKQANVVEDADRCDSSGVLVDTVRSDDLNDINVQNEDVAEIARTSSNTPSTLKNSSTSNSPSTVISPSTSAQEDTEQQQQQQQEQSMQSEEVGVRADKTIVDGVSTTIVETDEDGVHQLSVHEEEGKKPEVDEVGDVVETESSSVKGTVVEEGDALEEDSTHESHADDLAGTDSHTEVDVEKHDVDHDVQNVLNEMITRVEDEMSTGRSSSSSSPCVDVTTSPEPEGDDAVSGNQEGGEENEEEDAGGVEDMKSSMREEVLNAIVHEVLSRPGSGVDIQNDIQQATQEYLKGNTPLL